MSRLPDFLDLACPIQRMGFGPKGKNSLAYRVFQQGGHDATFGLDTDNDDTTFAELWMGATHEKAVSQVRSPAGLAGQKLSNILLSKEGQDHFLGAKLLAKFPKLADGVHGGVPFIFKVLSAGQALPLQVHPDIKSSERLRSQGQTEGEDVTVVDAMHKPEIALALTRFEAFVGFVPRKEILRRLTLLPELRNLASRSDVLTGHPLDAVENVYDVALEESEHSWRDVMSALTGRLLVAKAAQLQSTTQSILARHRREGIRGAEAVVDLIERVSAQHPGGDAGVLYAPVFMNHVTLEPGECLYARAGTCHSWLSGSIIECMPSSVNVVNSGFGPDASKQAVQLFTDMLTYEDVPASEFLLRPKHRHVVGLRDYKVPEEEFSILGVELQRNETTMISNEPLDGVAVFFCFQGSGKVEARHGDTQQLQAGTVVLVASGVTLTFASSVDEALSGYLAFCHLG